MWVIIVIAACADLLYVSTHVFPLFSQSQLNLDADNLRS